MGAVTKVLRGREDHRVRMGETGILIFRKLVPLFNLKLSYIFNFAMNKIILKRNVSYFYYTISIFTMIYNHHSGVTGNIDPEISMMIYFQNF